MSEALRGVVIVVAFGVVAGGLTFDPRPHPTAPVRPDRPAMPVEVENLQAVVRPRDVFFECLRYEESRSEADKSNIVVLEPNGIKSYGEYCITRAYWIDACDQLPELRQNGFARIKESRRYSERTIMAYADRYEPAALASQDWFILAALHNGGPNWRSSPAAVAYGNRVAARMKSRLP